MAFTERYLALAVLNQYGKWGYIWSWSGTCYCYVHLYLQGGFLESVLWMHLVDHDDVCMKYVFVSSHSAAESVCQKLYCLRA